MITFLYVVIGMALVVALLAFVQSRGGEGRRERYGARMRAAIAVAVLAGAAALVLRLATLP